nr:MAG TPA: hypothetical protein [Bacteriophage sp.]
MAYKATIRGSVPYMDATLFYYFGNFQKYCQKYKTK